MVPSWLLVSRIINDGKDFSHFITSKIMNLFATKNFPVEALQLEALVNNDHLL